MNEKEFTIMENEIIREMEVERDMVLQEEEQAWESVALEMASRDRKKSDIEPFVLSDGRKLTVAEMFSIYEYCRYENLRTYLYEYKELDTCDDFLISCIAANALKYIDKFDDATQIEAEAIDIATKNLKKDYGEFFKEYYFNKYL